MAQGNSARILSIEKSQATLQSEFSKVLATTVATSSAVEELKCLLIAYMGRAKGSDHGSPFVSKSILENPISSSIPFLEVDPVLPNTCRKRLSKNATLIAEDPSVQ